MNYDDAECEQWITLKMASPKVYQNTLYKPNIYEL